MVMWIEKTFWFDDYLIRAKRGDRVLDLCCGSGDLAFLLSQKVGIDGEVGPEMSDWLQGSEFPGKAYMVQPLKCGR
jgi:SAM-dependent methyltransferase